MIETIDKFDDLSKLNLTNIAVKYIRENIFPHIDDIIEQSEKKLLK